MPRPLVAGCGGQAHTHGRALEWASLGRPLVSSAQNIRPHASSPLLGAESRRPHIASETAELDGGGRSKLFWAMAAGQRC